MNTITKVFATVLLGSAVLIIGCDPTGVTGSDQILKEKKPSPLASSNQMNAAATEYEIVDLGTLDGSNHSATGVNNFGQVVGFNRSSSRRAFIWDTSGGIRSLGTLGGDDSRAYSINDDGLVVGGSSTSNNELRAFVWDEDSGMSSLGTLGGNLSRAESINNAGQVVGLSTSVEGDGMPFIWDKSNGMRELEILTREESGLIGGIAYSINEAGVAVGFSYAPSGMKHAVLWDESGTIHDLGFLGIEARALGINNNGIVVGRYFTSDRDDRAFIWDETNGMRDLGTLGGSESVAYDINDAGLIVGYSRLWGDIELRAVVWNLKGEISELATLGGNGAGAEAINESGQIVGFSSKENYGQYFPILWNPINTEINESPVANAGPNQFLECNGPLSKVSFNGSESFDQDGGELSYSWSLNGAIIASSPSPEVELPDGTHIITLTVTDPDGATDNDEVVIDIKDNQIPVISFILDHQNLWPPNHKMQQVISGIKVNDRCDPNVLVDIEVKSNEMLNGLGDGNTDEDWEVVQAPDGSYEVYVRAERSGNGSGRIYTVTMTAEDASGNVAEEKVEVQVTRDMGRALN